MTVNKNREEKSASPNHPPASGTPENNRTMHKKWSNFSIFALDNALYLKPYQDYQAATLIQSSAQTQI